MEIVGNYQSQKLFENYNSYLEGLIEFLGVNKVCDIGGGRNPQLGLDFVRKHAIDYTVMDISQEELDHAPADYAKLCADVGAKDFECEEEFDFVFSRMVAEHIKDGEQFHRNIYRMLKPSGVALHFFPTLYSLPFVVNRLIPEWLSDRVLHLVAPRDRVQHGKFPAYYSWTRGPTRKQLTRLEGLGFDVLLYAAGFGHAYYGRFPVVRDAANALSRWLVKRPNYLLCSFALLVLRRPGKNHGKNSLIKIPWP